MSTIVVKNWEKFQHYSNRDPTWIKLYRDVMTSESWVLGNDTSRLLQIAITLLAARYKNAIPNRFELIKKVASIDMTEIQFKKALQHLSEQNFLEIQGVEHPASTPLAQRYARVEESRGEEKREDISIPSESHSDKSEDVALVFDHWKLAWNHPRAALDPKRMLIIKRALKGYSAADLCRCISGYQNSTHHTGQNDRQTVYDSIDLFLRDAARIDAGLRFADTPQALTSDLANHNVRVLKEWRPPELRNATSGPDEISNDAGSPSGGVRKAAITGPY